MKIVIGKTDKANFPEFGLEDIDVKIDSGAYTSAIHCTNVRVEKKKGKKLLYFTLLDDSHPSYNHKEFCTSKFEQKKIKSSNGKVEKRYIILTEISLFKINYPVELSLSGRGDMRYPVLIGRKLLNQNFLIDTSKSNLSYKYTQSSKPKKKVKS